MKTGRDWASVRLDYITGKGSLRDLSEQHGIPLRSVERRCSSEGWRAAIDKAGGIVAAVAAETTKARGQAIGMEAADLVQRTVGVTDKLLQEIERRLDAGELTITQLRTLISGWRDVVTVGREAFNLDKDTPRQICIGVYGAGRVEQIKPVIENKAPTHMSIDKPCVEKEKRGRIP